jgi:hypothetical protein
MLPGSAFRFPHDKLPEAFRQFFVIDEDFEYRGYPLRQYDGMAALPFRSLPANRNRI